MKNRINFMFSLTFVALLLFACTRDNDDLIDNAASGLDDIEQSADAIAIRPFPAVDLTIASYTTNIAGTTTGCGGNLPDVSCLGQRNFMATVVVVNNGPGALGAGNLSVAWTDVTPAGSSTQVQTIPHGGIAAGGTLTFTRPYYMGPCGCPPPFTYYSHTFSALVDPGNAIPETNETNNGSPVYAACDGC